MRKFIDHPLTLPAFTFVALIAFWVFFVMKAVVNRADEVPLTTQTIASEAVE